MKLFLDDIRNPETLFYGQAGKEWILNPLYVNNSEWNVVRSFDEFVDFIEENGLPDLISFDHDLDWEAYLPQNQEETIDYGQMQVKTGYHAVEWLIDYCAKRKLKFPDYKVHSMNISGKKNMEEIIKEYLNR
jgi:hypothetical protein